MLGGSKSAEKYRYLKGLPILVLALLLLAACRLYGFAYFWLDDFHNLRLIRLRTFAEALGFVLSPSATSFRPVGMLVYQVAYALFDHDPRPYHWIMWGIHAFNVWLIYIVLKRLTTSRAGAAVGALLFVYPAVFTDIFWSFGTIFELTGISFFLTGILVWAQKKRTPALVLLATAIFILAMKSKEMAITLPAIWVLQDLLLRRPWKWKESFTVILPGLVGLWFGIQRFVAMQEPNPGQAYYMDLRAITMGHGLSWYFNSLLDTQFRWQVWCIGFVAAGVIFALLRWRLVLFFQAYIFVTFLPIIFLINHRDPFYWYFPMLGVCGIAALATKAVFDWMTSRVPERRLAVCASLVFTALALWTYERSRSETEERRLWQQQIARTFRGFVEGVQALPSPDPGATLYFTSMPDFFDSGTLLFASELALHRTDIDAQLVKDFPPGARYRLVFVDSRVVMLP